MRFPSSIMNFRSLGGIKACQGRKIKEGYLYRTSLIQNPSEKDIRYLESLQIDSMIDLRDLSSMEKHPEYVIKGAKYFHTDVLANIGNGASDSAINLDSVIVWGKDLSFQVLLRHLILISLSFLLPEVWYFFFTGVSFLFALPILIELFSVSFVPHNRGIHDLVAGIYVITYKKDPLAIIKSSKEGQVDFSGE